MLAAVVVFATRDIRPRSAAAALPPGARQAAPVDLTGNWVSVISEDWRFRMVTPPKGDYGAVPLNDEGRKVADTWDAAKDLAAGNAVPLVWRRRHHARPDPAPHFVAGRQHA